MRLLGLLALTIAAAWFAPQSLEDTPGPCAALEKRVLGLLNHEAGKLPSSIARDPRLAMGVAMLGGVTGTMQGRLAEAYVRDRIPQLPTAPACVGLWWKLVADPDLGPFLRGIVSR